MGDKKQHDGHSFDFQSLTGETRNSITYRLEATEKSARKKLFSIICVVKFPDKKEGISGEAEGLGRLIKEQLIKNAIERVKTGDYEEGKEYYSSFAIGKLYK